MKASPPHVGELLSSPEAHRRHTKHNKPLVVCQKDRADNTGWYTNTGICLMTYMGQLVSECGPYYCQSQLHWARLYFSSIETGKECVASGLFCTKAPSSSLCSYVLEPQLSWAQCPNWVHCVIWYDSICHNLLLTAALEFVLSPWVTWQGNEMEEGAQLSIVLSPFFFCFLFFHPFPSFFPSTFAKDRKKERKEGRKKETNRFSKSFSRLSQFFAQSRRIVKTLKKP